MNEPPRDPGPDRTTPTAATPEVRPPALPPTVASPPDETAPGPSGGGSREGQEDPGEPPGPAEQYLRLWGGQSPPDLDAFLERAGPLPPDELAAVLRVDQRRRWQSGGRPPAEFYLRRYPALAADREAALDLVYAEYLLREGLGERPDPAELSVRFPEHAPALREQVELHRALAPPDEPPPLRPRASGPAGPRPALPGYEILGELGRGGMGVVYKARQAGLNRLVALKLLLSGAHAGADEHGRFLREAEAVARLKHPGIVDVYAFGEIDGRPYFSLEYLEGGSLADRLRAGPLPPRQAAALAAELARAVDHAHRHGIVHRDLKPANVLLTADGRPKVSDFGLAKELAVEGLTQSGAVMGTPSYMPPEQAEGKARHIGPAADVYSLGAVLYEMLVGRPPFRATTTLDTLLLVLGSEAAAPRDLNPGVPPELEAVCLKCLSKAPEDRYASARLLAEDLTCIVRGDPLLHARPPSAWRYWNQFAWRATNTPLWSLLVATALLLVLLPCSGMQAAVLPIAAAVAAVFLLARPDAGSAALAGLGLLSVVVPALGFYFLVWPSLGWQDPPWGWTWLGLAVPLAGFVAPCVGLRLSPPDRRLCAALLALAALNGLGLALTGSPLGLTVGLMFGALVGAVARVTAEVSGEPAGIGLAGAFWGVALNPCGCGLLGPLVVLDTAAGSSGPNVPNDWMPLLAVSSVYGPLYAGAAVLGAVVNVWLYRLRRRKLWERSGYAGALHQGSGKEGSPVSRTAGK